MFLIRCFYKIGGVLFGGNFKNVFKLGHTEWENAYDIYLGKSRSGGIKVA